MKTIQEYEAECRDSTGGCKICCCNEYGVHFEDCVYQMIYSIRELRSAVKEINKDIERLDDRLLDHDRSFRYLGWET